METARNGERYSQYYRWENMRHLPYDYDRDGLLKKVVSHKIWETDNPVLRAMLDVWERSLVWCMKAADVLCQYKNYLWLNR